MQYQIPAEMTAAVRKQSVTVAIADWPLASIEKIFAYGFQQLLNDAAAPAKDESEIMPLVQKRIDNLANGVLRASPNRESDPVKAEAIRIATGMVEKALKAKGLKVKDVGATKVRELAKELIAKNESITATAQANVTATKDLSIDVDLEGLDND
jgi:hypothetical protein